ncbi:Uncharacterised protein [Actinobacillus pleuropneumoniae]|uniref:hypothetical protein n=1 Tax=Actinobacillus pleuropneumoniae TaxID=715 RepID=UPI0001E49F46|nr:hypothetical protein [Actinobacillus pleuropneumoniae]EFM88792.1 hypothetical protein appser4_20690 [Actinobacillus pleuropneumoniae serovar 4 str. M62]UKH40778.1 hypothetical protein D1097_02905 [Actinobacillus pleuropneumoniae serovar 4 str. M62]SQF64298.1 Uncharacterised protein [Actinobacillus pleuropneumoniae]
MVSEQDKQAILNGAYGVTRDGRKVKYLGCNNGELDHYPWKFIQFDSKGQMENKLLNLKFSRNSGFYSNPVADSQDDVIGLWQDKPEPFNLGRALKGECVNYNGEPCYIYYSNRETETHEYIVEAVSGAFVLGRVPLYELEKCAMWKEPEPQLSSNSLQLPKPLTEPLNNDDNYFTLASRNGKYVIDDWRWKDKTSDHIFLREARIYKTKDDVIKVIEIITGKPYEDR